MQRSSPGRPLTETPFLSNSAFRVSYVPAATLSARWLRSLPAVRGAPPGCSNRATPLFPGVQENLSFVFPIHGHAENLGVKSFRALDIVDVQHDVVHPIRLNHRSLLNFGLAEAQPQ
jgi:hypothetical protein